MKDWQFITIVVLVGVTLFIVVKIGTGLQAAQTKVESAGNVVTGMLGKLGIRF